MCGKGNLLTEIVDCVVIGAGVVGLAAARALSLQGAQVLILDGADAIGTGVSSRNSEVLHAGLYYPSGSLKAALCVEGNRLLRAFASGHHVDFRSVGKLVVATTGQEEQRLHEIWALGRANGAQGLALLTAAQAGAMESELSCTAALWSPDTGIIDAHGLMLALLADAEAHGAQLALRTPVIGGHADAGGMVLMTGGDAPMTLRADRVVIAAGLKSPEVGRVLGLMDVPLDYLCKGSYFSIAGKQPFSHLVYPIPVQAGLGVHYTVDLQGRGRFGPDVEWVDSEDYQVNPARALPFRAAISRYWPGLGDRDLVPAYAGIRPKVTAPGEAAADFIVHGPGQTGIPGVAAFYGIESPGLTSCLALGRMVAEMIA